MADPPDETPIQRALRLKTAALQNRAQPGSGRFQSERAAAARSASKSKPKG
jgi:hypothetical protein